MAYASLGRLYADLDESDLSAQNLEKAWALKEHASEHERFFITANYLSLVTGNVEQSRQVAEAWAQTYPRDPMPRTLLSGVINKTLGRYEEEQSPRELYRVAGFHADDTGTDARGDLVPAKRPPL